MSLTTTRAGSQIWGVGNDWDRATARTVGSGQTKIDELLASAGDTMWVQRQTAATALPGSVATLNDTAPTNDRWNMAAVEVLPAVTDTQAPTAPAELAAGTVTATQVPLSWSAGSDDQGVGGYRVARGTTQVGDVPGTSFTDKSVAASTTYEYTVRAYDAAGAPKANGSVPGTTPDRPDKTAAPAEKIERIDLATLKDMSVGALTKIAKQLDVPGATGMRKQELIF